MLTDYTTPASVRSVLGVSMPEIKDDVVQSPIYETLLEEKLYSLNPQMTEDYLAAKEADPKTHLQERFVNVMQTYAAYHVASQMLGSVAMFAPKVIEDSRTKLERFNDAYKALGAEVLGTLSYLEGKLLGVYALINPDAPVPAKAARISVVNVPLGLNPITG